MSQSGPNPTAQFASVGIQQINVYPWVAGSTYPFPSDNGTPLYGLKTLGLTLASKSAILTGGETVDDIDAWEVSRETKIKITNAKADLRYWNLMLNGTLIVDPKDSNGDEVQYLTKNFTDRAGYMTLVGIRTNGNGQELFIFPKVRVDGNISYSLDMDKVTEIDCEVRALQDGTYIRQDGVVGGIFERMYVDGDSALELHS